MDPEDELGCVGLVSLLFAVVGDLLLDLEDLREREREDLGFWWKSWGKINHLVCLELKVSLSFLFALVPWYVGF